MTYATGSATTMDNLMAAIFAFAVAHTGMTADSLVSQHWPIASTQDTDLYNFKTLSKGGRYWSFAWRTDKLFGMPTLTNTQNWEDYASDVTLANGPRSPTQMFPIFAPFTSYHLFTEGTVVHCAIEMSNGSWQHMNFGDVTKYSAWPAAGGHYLSMQWFELNSFYDNLGVDCFYLFSDVGGNAPGGVQASYMAITYGGLKWGSWTGNLQGNPFQANALSAYSFMRGIADRIIRDQPNVFNDRAMGLRMDIFVKDNQTGGSNLWLPCGYIPNIRAINIRDLNAKDIINTDWMVFPVQTKGHGLINTYATTGNYGWAVRK